MAKKFSKIRLSRVQLRRKALLAKILPICIVGSTAYLITTLSPAKQQIAPAKRIITEGVRIELDHTSPAFAAMEDTLLGDKLTEFESALIPDNPVSVSLLEAGKESIGLLIDQVVRDNRRETVLMGQARAAREMAETQMAEAAADAFEKLASHFATRVSAAKTADAKSPAGQKLANQTNTVLSASDKTKFAAAGTTQAPSRNLDSVEAVKPIEVPTQTIHLSELGVSREQFMREFFMPLATADVSDAPESSLPAQPMLAGGVYRPISSRRQVQPAFAGGDGRVAGLNPRFDRASQPAAFRPGAARAENVHQNVRLAPPLDSSIMNAQAFHQAPAPHRLVLNGHLEFVKGLAITNPNERVIVYREFEGETFEQGTTSLRDANYEIFVDRPEGNLVAELRTPQGEVLGRGLFDLEQMGKLGMNQTKVEALNLKLRPLVQGITGEVHSLAASKIDSDARSSAALAPAAFPSAIQGRPVAGVGLELEGLPFNAISINNGTFEEPNLMEGSTTFIKTQRKGFLPTRVFAAAGSTNLIELISDRVIQKINQDSRERRDRNIGMIIGRVARSGKVVSAAQVELASDGERVKPIYFNENLEPDLTLEATTANGLYAFYPLPQATYGVRASWGALLSDPVLITAADRSAAQADLDVGQSRKAKLKVFDAFNSQTAVRAEINKVGSDESPVSVPVDGTGSVRFSSGATPLHLDVDGGKEYETIRVLLTRDRKSAYIPMIQSAWAEKVRNGLRVNSESHTGTIIGFIQGRTPYEVSMDEQSVLPGTKLVFFNAQGIVSDRQIGEPGGGFMILNVPEGYRTVLVQPKNLNKSYAATVLVENKVTNVINHLLR